MVGVLRATGPGRDRHGSVGSPPRLGRCDRSAPAFCRTGCPEPAQHRQDELPAFRGRLATLRTIIVPPSVVAVLRRGLLLEMSNAAERLGRLTDSGRLEGSRPYRDVISRIDAARNLLDQVGALAPDTETPIKLELNEYSLTAFRIVETRQTQVIQAAEDAEDQGRPRPPADPVLDQFVRRLRGELEAATRRERMPFDG